MWTKHCSGLDVDGANAQDLSKPNTSQYRNAVLPRSYIMVRAFYDSPLPDIFFPISSFYVSQYLVTSVTA